MICMLYNMKYERLSYLCCTTYSCIFSEDNKCVAFILEKCTQKKRVVHLNEATRL